MCHVMQAAGLTLTLQSKYAANTVFAPTNEAFASLFKRLDVSQGKLFADTAKITEVSTVSAEFSCRRSSVAYHVVVIAGLSGLQLVWMMMPSVASPFLLADHSAACRSRQSADRVLHLQQPEAEHPACRLPTDGQPACSCLSSNAVSRVA
jgi:Fasciclin domain